MRQRNSHLELFLFLKTSWMKSFSVYKYQILLLFKHIYPWSDGFYRVGFQINLSYLTGSIAKVLGTEIRPENSWNCRKPLKVTIFVYFLYNKDVTNHLKHATLVSLLRGTPWKCYPLCISRKLHASKNNKIRRKLLLLIIS